MIGNVKDKGVREERIKLVPNWIDVKKAAVGKKKGCLFPSIACSGKFTVAYAGNIGIKQGIDVLVRVAKELENNPNIHFFIIGEGADKQRMLDLAKELGITNITFLPFLNPSGSGDAFRCGRHLRGSTKWRRKQFLSFQAPWPYGSFQGTSDCR